MDKIKEAYQHIYHETPYTEQGKRKAIRCLYSPEMAYKDKHHLGIHCHDYCEIIYMYSGSVECHIDGNTHILNPGDIIVINSQEPHGFLSLSRKREHVCIQFDPYVLYSGDQSMSIFKNFFENLFNDGKRNRIFKNESVQSTPISDIFSEIIQEWYGREPGYDLFIRAKVTELFGHIYRLWSLSCENPISMDIEVTKFAEIVKTYINENYASATEPQAADECGLSVGYFSKQFKKTFKMSFRQYLTNVRIYEAAKLLTTSDINVTSCAESVGFSSPGYFIKKFKEIYGVSPKKYADAEQES